MNLCIGERIDGPDWTGLPLGRFAPPGHASSLPVAAAQDTIFVWKDGASAAQVRWHREVCRYARHSGVLDVMGADEETFIMHDNPEAPGECLLIALPREVRESFGHGQFDKAQLSSAFGFDDPMLYQLATTLEWHCRAGQPSGVLYTESLSAALVTHACTRYARPVGSPARATKFGSRRLSAAQQGRIYRFVEERLGSDISLRELAALAGYSQAHFLRLFRQTFQQTPHQFVVHLRIERAKRLLQGDRHSLVQVARACGFADQSHFGATFSRATGTTPGRFRAASVRGHPDDLSGARGRAPLGNRP